MPVTLQEMLEKADPRRAEALSAAREAAVSAAIEVTRLVNALNSLHAQEAVWANGWLRQNPPPGLDATDVLRAMGEPVKLDGVYRAHWRQRRKELFAEVYLYKVFDFEWSAQWGYPVASLRQNGVPYGKRRPVVTPERLVELCGRPAPKVDNRP